MELLKNYNDYLTVNDIYNILPVGRTKIYALIRNCRIKANLVGNKYVISKVSLIKFMENTEKENYDE